MLKRSPFKSKAPPPRPSRQMDYTARPRAVCRVADTSARLVIPRDKEQPLRSEKYRRWCATLPCAHCRRPGPSQCAHGDEGKGMSIKATDAGCYPLCADSPGRRGCHSMLGASGLLGREVRRLLETKYGRDTKVLAQLTANWPSGWPA